MADYCPKKDLRDLRRAENDRLLLTGAKAMPALALAAVAW
jgi:hypothetical protein